MPEEFKAGTYTLIHDLFEAQVLDDKGKPVETLRYEKGDALELDDDEAKRLGGAGAVARVDSAKAKEARGEIDPGVVPPGLSPEQLRERGEALLAEAKRQEKLVKEEKARAAKAQKSEG